MIELGNGTPQIQRNRVNPIVTWEFTVSDVAIDSLVPIQQFHDARFGSFEKFLWTDKDGTQHTVRFANDTQEINEIIGWDTDGIKKVLAYTTTVQLRKVFT